MNATDTDCPVREGDVLAGKYRVEKIIGIGGMGVVVSAQHIHLSQQVAVKFLLPSACKNAEAVGRFIREARAAVRIQSEHVARVTDVGTLDDTGAPYMVMEFLKGEDLSSVLHNRGKLSVSDAVNYVLQACEAIAEAHAAGIIHRDLKPANLFLTKRADGSALVKVLDFGISKASILDPSDPGSQSLTSTGTAMGSPLYMSPEQVRDSKNVDVRTDIWALGAILFELVAGRNVFQADTLPSLIAKIISESPDKLLGICPDIPEEFSFIVDKCLQKNVADRYATVGELALALLPFTPRGSRLSIERIVGVLGTRAQLPPSVAPPAVSPVPAQASNPQAATVPAWGTTMKQAPKKSRLVVVGLAVGLVFLVLGGAYFGVVRMAAATSAAPVNAVSVETAPQAKELPLPTPSASAQPPPPEVASASPTSPAAPVVAVVTAPAVQAKSRGVATKEKPPAGKTPPAAPAAPAAPAKTRDPLVDP